MKAESTTRERLLAEGMRQLLAYGYEGVGLGPVLKAVDVPKGSFYYFFRSKDDFVVAVILAYEARYDALRERIFRDERRRPLQRLAEYFAVLEGELQERAPFAGCLYGVIAQTVAGRDSLVQQALAQAFARWQAHVAALLATAQQQGEIAAGTDLADLAASIIEAYEGALIRMKATQDPAVFTRFRTVRLPELLRRQAPEGPVETGPAAVQG